MYERTVAEVYGDVLREQDITLPKGYRIRTGDIARSCHKTGDKRPTRRIREALNRNGYIVAGNPVISELKHSEQHRTWTYNPWGRVVSVRVPDKVDESGGTPHYSIGEPRQIITNAQNGFRYFNALPEELRERIFAQVNERADRRLWGEFRNPYNAIDWGNSLPHEVVHASAEGRDYPFVAEAIYTMAIHIGNRGHIDEIRKQIEALMAWDAMNTPESWGYAHAISPDIIEKYLPELSFPRERKS